MIQTAADPSVGEAVFVFATAGATATAPKTDDGYVVLAGSSPP